MEAIHFDAGTIGTAPGSFTKAQGQAGTKGGGLFAALLSLVGAQGQGDGQGSGQSSDDGTAVANSGLPGLLALLYPTLNLDQTAGRATDGAALTALSADGAADATILKSQNAMALLAQALAQARGTDGKPIAGIDLAALGLDADPSTSANLAAGISLVGSGNAPTTATANDVNALLAELRTRAAAKFGDANGDAAITADGLAAAIRQAATETPPSPDRGKPAWASSSAQDPRPLTPGLEQALPAKAAPFGLDGGRGDKAAPALAAADNRLVASPTDASAGVPLTAASTDFTATPAVPASDRSAPPIAAAPAATPAVAGGALTDADPAGDSPSNADAATPRNGDNSASPTDTASSGTAARGGIADGTNGTTKSADPAATPFRAVEMQAPPTAKPPTSASADATPPAADAKRAEPPAAPTPSAATDDRSGSDTGDRADAASAGSDSRRPTSADGTDASTDGVAPFNAALADARSHAGSSRAAIQVPVERLTQFLTQPDQLALQIQRAAAGNRDHITIQLMPQDLGHIEIKLDFDKSGGVNAVIAADRPHTLDLLRRDAAGLERALQDAGFKADSGSLSFNLRGDQRQYQNPHGNPDPTPWTSAATDSADRAYLPAYRFASTADAIYAVANGRVDIAV
ncbi:MAG: flagellar hook-length control protein FliK [Pseudomonadota bacterium]